MVIVNSDSNTTLVSLDQYENDLKFGHNIHSADTTNYSEDPQKQLCRTELLVEDGTYLARNMGIGSRQPPKLLQPLCLPKDRRCLDEYMKGYESLRTSCEELLMIEPRCYTNTGTTERLIYVAQGERANATSNECDVLVSDKATTCHILALHSCCSNTNNNNGHRRNTLPLSSLTHIDGTGYDQSIREMIQEHVIYHSGRNNHGYSTLPVSSKITIEIHIMGGFNDKDSTSSSITDWLLGLLAQIAEEYILQQEDRPSSTFDSARPMIDMVLKTCAVTTMNDTGYSCPIGRGMGIDLHTGQVFLARCHQSVMGPVPILRSVRLWSKSEGHTNTLSVIHSVTEDDASSMYKPGQMVIQPFAFAPFPDIPLLLALPDDILLQYTSTSPDVEEDGFCDAVRASMKFLLQSQHHACYKIFGRHVDQPLVFSRVSHGNDWRRRLSC